MFDILSLGFSLTVVGGGMAGYFKSNSVPSLVSGIAFGAFIAAGSYQLNTHRNNPSILLVSCSLLAIMMGFRFAKSQKIIPAGLICLLSALMALRSALIIWK